MINEGVSTSKLKTTWQKVWRVARWFLLVFVLFYAFGLAMNGYHWWKTPAAVERIHARTVTMEMVMGENLPPEPSADERDRTVAGVDSNGNGVRDDVELEIHRRHTDSAKIRAAQLQYAMGFQGQLTAFNGKTLVAALQEKGRGFSCIHNIHQVDFSSLPDTPSEEWTREELDYSNRLAKEHDAIVDPLLKEIEELVLNIESRRKAHRDTDDFMMSYGSGDKPRGCDIDLQTLPN